MRTTTTATPREDAETNFTGNQRRRKDNKEQKERKMRPRHPRPKDRHLMDLFEQYTSRDKLQTVRWTDQVRPNRAKHSFEGKSKMAHKVMIEVHGNKKRRKTTWLPLTRGARHGKPRQGQDTRLCRDATNKAIKAIRGVIKSRDKFKSQPSSLHEYRCRCRCKTTCPYK